METDVGSSPGMASLTRALLSCSTMFFVCVAYSLACSVSISTAVDVEAMRRLLVAAARLSTAAPLGPSPPLVSSFTASNDESRESVVISSGFAVTAARPDATWLTTPSLSSAPPSAADAATLSSESASSARVAAACATRAASSSALRAGVPSAGSSSTFSDAANAPTSCVVACTLLLAAASASMLPASSAMDADGT